MQIKENRRAGGLSAGPQSQILEGVTWDEARQVQVNYLKGRYSIGPRFTSLSLFFQEASLSGTGDQVILVGAASKGIIQRDFQHHAVVYKSPYAKNPFDNVSNEEIEAYKQSVARKQRGEGEILFLITNTSFRRPINFLVIGDTSQDESTPLVSPVDGTFLVLPFSPIFLSKAGIVFPVGHSYCD